MEGHDPDGTEDERTRPDEGPDAERTVGDDLDDAPAAGVLDPDLEDPPEPNEPG